MPIGSIIAIFFVVWWIVLFAVLPFGVRTQQEDGEVVPGSEASAPTALPITRTMTKPVQLNPRSWMIFVATEPWT